MRLTNTMKEAFVRAAMQDVPKVDYDDKIRSLVNKQIKQLHKSLGIDKVEINRLASNYDYARPSKGGSETRFHAGGLTNPEAAAIAKHPDVVALVDAMLAQNEMLSTLKQKLTGAINACNTRKQAAEALPEFEKYLPEDEQKALRSLPALANVAADFVKAGWPKPQSKARATATA